MLVADAVRATWAKSAACGLGRTEIEVGLLAGWAAGHGARPNSGTGGRADPLRGIVHRPRPYRPLQWRRLAWSFPPSRH